MFFWNLVCEFTSILKNQNTNTEIYEKVNSSHGVELSRLVF